MNHFRDSRPGRFYLHSDRIEQPGPQPNQSPAFLRFAAKQGVSLNLWKGEVALARDLVRGAGLDWPVMSREMIVPAGPGLSHNTNVGHYYALVRPDTEQIMSVVTSAYAPAHNQWVASALESYASRFTRGPSMIAAVGFGRAGDRTFFAARLMGDEHDAVCLLGYNSHGGEGAVRFEIVEVDRERQITYVLGSAHSARTFSHIGDLEERLTTAASGPETFIERYLAETKPLWERLEDTLWTYRHTAALIDALWGKKSEGSVGKGEAQDVDFASDRHPRRHLMQLMDGIADAASAYRAICDWIDNHSEACERGDFTKDRDERLALGAGNSYKRDAWRWILHNAA